MCWKRAVNMLTKHAHSTGALLPSLATARATALLFQSINSVLSLWPILCWGKKYLRISILPFPLCLSLMHFDLVSVCSLGRTLLLHSQAHPLPFWPWVASAFPQFSANLTALLCLAPSAHVVQVATLTSSTQISRKLSLRQGSRVRRNKIQALSSTIMQLLPEILNQTEYLVESVTSIWIEAKGYTWKSHLWPRQRQPYAIRMVSKTMQILSGIFNLCLLWLTVPLYYFPFNKIL